MMFVEGTGHCTNSVLGEEEDDLLMAKNTEVLTDRTAGYATLTLHCMQLWTPK